MGEIDGESAAEMPAVEMPAADPGLLLGGPPTRITVTVA